MKQRLAWTTLVLLVVSAIALLPSLFDSPVRSDPASPSGGAGTIAEHAVPSTPGGTEPSRPDLERAARDRVETSDPLTRRELYRALRTRESAAEVQSLVALLHRAWGDEVVALVAGDFRRAIEDDDSDAVAAIAAVLALIAADSAAGVTVDDRLRWIGFLDVSDPAAAAVRGILLVSGSVGRREAEEVVALWPASGWETPFRERVGRELLLTYADRSREREFFRELLHTEKKGLRHLAMTALVRIGGFEALAEITEVFEGSSARERARWAPQLVAALPAEQSISVLLEWQERWPEMSFADAWMAVGYRDGQALVDAYELAERANIRRDVLIGWSPESLEPGRAEAFLSQVLDLDPAPTVRAQALIALGQVDHPRARARLEEATRTVDAESAHYAQHLASGIRNALHAAPVDWVHAVAVPFASRQILGANELRRPGEEARWRAAFLRRGEGSWAAVERSITR